MAEILNMGSRGRISTVPTGPPVSQHVKGDRPHGRFQHKNRDPGPPVSQHGKEDGPHSRFQHNNRDPAEFRPVMPAHFCAPCHGPHDEKKVNNPFYESYSIKKRLVGLRILETTFYAEMKEGRVPVKLDGNKPHRIVWTLKNNDGAILNPARMTQEDYVRYLPLMFDGCREQHEPHRYVAFEAGKEMIASGGPKLLECIPHLIRPLSVGLQTMEPSLVAVQLVLLKRMVEVNRWMAPALVPYLRKILPPISIFKYRHDLVVLVPPPKCTAATGSRTGRGAATDSNACNVCGKLIDPDSDYAARKAAAVQRGFDAPPPPKKKNVTALPMHRPNQKYKMSELIADIMILIEDNGGDDALRQIKKFVPSWGLGTPPP